MRIATVPLAAAAVLCVWCRAAEEGAPAADDSREEAPPDDGKEDVWREFERRLEAMEAEHAAQMKALKEEIEALRRERAAEPASGEDTELAKLVELAEAEASAAREEGEEAKEETTFTLGGISLQALNPEISVVGDMVGRFSYQEETRERAEFDFRTLGIHIESYLDPYSKLKAAIPVTTSWTKLGEAYITRYGVLEGLNITAGKFRQQFGVVNRWHEHALDQVDFPFALRQIFGDGGLNQTGLSFDWTMPPLLGASQKLVVQVTNGENERLFSGNTLSTPSCLARYSNYRDLTEDLYLDWGLSGIMGWNDEWDVIDGGGVRQVDRELSTRVFGADVTFFWEPTDRMRYRNLVWRSEGYFLNREILAPDDGKRDTIDAWGAYSYVESKVARTWNVGARFDFFAPDRKGYAGLVPSLSPLVVGTGGAYRWGVGPYVTWEQSPFVKVRLEYDYLDGKGTGDPEHLVLLQVIFAAGPHKHDRY